MNHLDHLLGRTKEPERVETVVRAYAQCIPAREFEVLSSWFCTFYPFQLEWLLESSRFAVDNKSRQIGMSHTTAAAVVLWGSFLGETSTLISIGQRESDELLDKAKRHATALSWLGSKWAASTERGEELRFGFSGGRIIALPSSSGGRSFSGNVVLDEFGYLEHPKTVWDGAAAVTLHDGKFRVLSTPNGVGNEFHNLWSNPKAHKGWAKHECTLERALGQGMRVDMDDCWKMAKGDPRIFDQLFNCKFLDGELQYIPSEAVDACSVDGITIGPGDFYGGLDIGRSADLTSLAIVRKREDGLRLLQFLKTCKRTDSVALDNMVDEAFARFHLKRLCVDESGLGIFPVELMQKRHGRIRVEGVTFTQQSKEALATGLYSAFTEEYVRIPKTDDALPGMAPGSAVALRDDICSIRRIITAAGNIRYDAPHTDDGHADRAWSLALALHACAGPAGQKFVASGR